MRDGPVTRQLKTLIIDHRDKNCSPKVECARECLSSLGTLANRALTMSKNFGKWNKGHYERVFSLEESLDSLNFLNSLKSLENGWIPFCFPQSGPKVT